MLCRFSLFVVNTDHATTGCSLDDYRSSSGSPTHARLLHDVRGRLNVIVTSAELLAAEKHGALNQKQSRYVSGILRSASGIAEQLLQLDSALTRLNTREEPVRAE
jgi:hypothetical protein